MSLDQWLLALHVTGAFLVPRRSGDCAASSASLALRSTPAERDRAVPRPDTRRGRLIGVGAMLTLVLGLWLVHRLGYSYASAG